MEIAFAVDTQHQITSIDDDNLYVLFPTTEKTGLRFLLNGPYRTNPARETISKKDAFNTHLMKVTCELMKELLPQLRERQFLTVQFLSVLPNKEDELTHEFNWLEVFRKQEEKLRGFYTPLHDIIIHEFRNEKLTPTERRNYYSPAYELYRGSRELLEVIRDDDLATLLGKDRHLPLWVKNPPLKNRRRDERGRYVQDENSRKQNERINDFLETLDTPKWTDEDLIKVLMSNTECVVEWLKGKLDEWHQNLYAFLEDTSFSYYYESKLPKLCIVRCTDGLHRIGSECHFSGDVKPNQDLLDVSTVFDEEDLLESQEEEHKEDFNYVVNAVYASGDSEIQQEKVRKFLETIGVKKVNETERIKMILDHRYTEDLLNHVDEKQHIKDMQKFIAFFEKEPDETDLFKDYHIFETTGGRVTANYVFLDSPYLETGLSTCYEDDRYTEKLEDMTVDSPYFSLLYEESDIDLKKLGKFAEALGAKTKLEAIEQTIPYDHPQKEHLDSAPGEKESKYCINKDYIIEELSVLLNKPSIAKSKLIWRTMSHIRESFLNSQHRKSASYESRYGYSNLVHQLRKAKWVPQKEDDSISFVCPCNASIDYLPEGFPYETGQEWLKVIEFGKKTKEHQEEHNQRNQQAKNFGFNSSEKAEKYAKLDQILEEHGMSPDDLISQYSSRSSEINPDFPTAPVKNPEFRKERITEQIRNAPEKAYEERIRNERPSKSDIDQRTSLKEWYTNESGEMVCQICRKVMPFKKTDGEYYFIAIEALTIRFMNDQLPENHFLKELEAQYLALCPECAARYDYFVRAVKDGVTLMEELRNHLIDSEDMEFPLKLGELDTSIRFVEAHFKDLKAALHYYENIDDAEDSTD